MRSHEKKQIASPRCVPNLRVKSTVNTSALRSTWPGCTKKSWNCQCIFRASGNFYPKSPLSTSREEKNEKILSWLVKYWRNIAFFFFLRGRKGRKWFSNFVLYLCFWWHRYTSHKTLTFVCFIFWLRASHVLLHLISKMVSYGRKISRGGGPRPGKLPAPRFRTIEDAWLHSFFQPWIIHL